MNPSGDWFRDTLGISLMPHLYAIPFSIILGMAIGYYLRGRIEGGSKPPQLPKPKV
jgi:hypothetical protein